jgi:hypothetical protein
MPKIRRPWPVSRRDTDGLQAQASSSQSEVLEMSEDLKNPQTNTKAVEAETDLKKFNKLHQWDPNLESSKRDAIEQAVKSHDVEAEVQMDHELEENSPYPEVVGSMTTMILL